MSRFLAAALVALASWSGLLAPTSARGQTWNDARTLAIVRRATARRAATLADTGLVDYTARAHGYLTFLGQLGEGFREPPKVVRADELELEVYWHAPNISKQRIIGRRDTLLLPTDIEYHRDHLGIVQNNFPDIIRIGEGDEVQDVPHPLSPRGLVDYDFAIADSLRIRLPDRTLDVYEMRVRPKDENQPRIVGAIYVDTTNAEVVRMAFSFTRPAYLDRELEDITIVLENALVEGRFWLPRRQEVEIRRTGTWLDFPARGIIRGRWEICCYRVNTGAPMPYLAGPEIVQASPRELAGYPWTGRILDSLPSDVRAVTEADVKRVTEQARELVRAQALARPSGAALSARRISDFARVNRVEGLAVGGGGTVRLGAGLAATLGGRWGFADEQAKGRLVLDLRRAGGFGAELFAERAYRDARDVPERSLLINSFAAQEFGSDGTQPYDVRGAGAAVELGGWHGVHWRLQGSYEWQDRLRVHASPARGTYAPTIPAWPVDETRIAVSFERPTGLSLFGTELRLNGELRGALLRGRDTSLAGPSPRYGRAFLAAQIERPMGDQRLVLQTTIAAVGGRPVVPPQEYVFLGGPVTGPGYAPQRFASTFGASQRLEWRIPVPFVAVPLGSYGHAPARATLAPFVQTVYVSGVAPFAEPARGWYASVGLGALVLFDILRLDVARALRNGGWTFSIDATRDFWRVL